VYKAKADTPPRLHVFGSDDERSTFETLVDDVEVAYEMATGESLNLV